MIYQQSVEDIHRDMTRWWMGLIAAMRVWGSHDERPEETPVLGLAPFSDEEIEEIRDWEERIGASVSVLEYLRGCTDKLTYAFLYFEIDAAWMHDACELFGRHCEDDRTPGLYSRFLTCRTKALSGFAPLILAAEAHFSAATNGSASEAQQPPMLAPPASRRKDSDDCGGIQGQDADDKPTEIVNGVVIPPVSHLDGEEQKLYSWLVHDVRKASANPAMLVRLMAGRTDISIDIIDRVIWRPKSKRKYYDLKQRVRDLCEATRGKAKEASIPLAYWLSHTEVHKGPEQPKKPTKRNR